MNKYKLQELEGKAEIMCDAFPYIRDFSQKIVVIDYECGAFLSGIQEQSLMQDIVLLKSIGMRPVVVHNTRLGMDKFRENKRLANLMEQCGTKAIGICGIDEQTLRMTIANDYIPVVVPNDIDNEMMPIDPKDTSMEIAQLLEAEKLIYLTDFTGVYRDEGRRSIFPVISVEEIQELRRQVELPEELDNIIDHCIMAVESNVNRGHILNGCIEHVLLIELFSKVGAGTAILMDKGRLYQHEKSSLPSME